MENVLERCLAGLAGLAMIALFGGGATALCLAGLQTSLWYGLPAVCIVGISLYAAGHVIWSCLFHT